MVKYGADPTAVNKVSYNRPPLLLAAENGSFFACKMLVDQLKQDINVISIEDQGILETIEQNRKFMATRKEKIRPGKGDCPLVHVFFGPFLSICIALLITTLTFTLNSYS
jgi:hypothetical protein